MPSSLYQLKTNAVLELKADKAKRTIEGYASVFDVVDLGDDVMLQGAFARTLTEGRGKRSPLLWQHDATQPIGRPKFLEETATGLHFVDVISKTRLGDEVLELTADGVIDGVSIGYEPRDFGFAERADGRKVRQIKDVELWERSIVTFPMNEAARLTAVQKRFWPGWSAPASRERVNRKANDGPVGVAVALNVLLAENADGNRADLVERMATGAGITTDEVGAILNGEPQCPAPDTLRAMAEAIGIDAAFVLAAGNRAGCGYELASPDEDAEAPESEARGFTDEQRAELTTIITEVVTGLLPAELVATSKNASAPLDALHTDLKSFEDWLNERENR